MKEINMKLINYLVFSDNIRGLSTDMIREKIHIMLCIELSDLFMDVETDCEELKDALNNI